MRPDQLEPGSSRSWREWGLDEWNAALLRSFFSAADMATPVTRLLVTREEFMRVAAVREHQAHAALEAFLSVVRERLQGPPTRSLIADARRLASSWCIESSTIPPFLSHLFVTCLAASDVMPGSKPFRERLSALLRLDLTQHGLTDDTLRRLWQSLAHWLQFQHDCGDTSLRLIELPSLRDVGSLTIIGVSVWLAFPSARDRRHLMSALDDAVVDPFAPDLASVVAAVRRREPLFSPVFRDAFEAFVAACTRAAPECDRLPFWLAVRDCLGSRAVDQFRERGVTTVIAEADEDDNLSVFVLADDVAAARSRRWRALPLAITVQGCGYVLTPEQHTLSSVNEIAAEFVPSLSRRIDEGLVLFQQDEDAVWMFRPTLREDGPGLMLVRDDRLPLVGPAASSLNIRRSQYESWYEVRCDDIRRCVIFDQWKQNGVSTFAESIKSSDATLVGGVRLDGGWLGRKSFLPAVICSDATAVMASDDCGCTTELAKSSTSQWRFPAKDLSGLVTIRATLPSGNDRIRTARFYHDVIGQEYVQPRERRWLCETGATDLVDYSAEASTISCNEGISWPSAASSTGAYRAATLGQDLDSDDLTTALAIMSKSGDGIAEKRVVETVARVEPNQARAWGVIRSLVEIGAFNRLVDKHWRAARYFAVSPHVVMFPSGAAWVGVVIGLVQPAVRNAVVAAAKKYGLDVCLKGGSSRVVPAVIHATTSTSAQLCDVAAACGLELRQLKPLTTIVQPVPLTRIPQAAPLNYRPHLTWSWTRRSFAEVGSDSTSDICVNWYRRDDSPDVFTIDHEQHTLFQSRSRTWALLVGYALRREASFEPTATGLRSIASAVVLPLPIARLATITGNHLPNHEPGQNTYCFGSEAGLRAVVTRLWPTQRPKSAVAWLQQALSSGYFDGSPSVAASCLGTLRLPPEIREALMQRTSVPVELLPILHSLSRQGTD